jgi:hypothetical protein
MVKAIPTRYDGRYFRSRLEARWAVFFNSCGIRYHYETEGFYVSERLYPASETTFAYLPDFWLPDQELWVEVKGSLTDDECWKVLNAAASLSSNDGGGCHDSGGNDMLALGPIPQGPGVVPIRIHMHKGDLTGYPWDPFGGRPQCGTHRWTTSMSSGSVISDWLLLARDSGDLYGDGALGLIADLLLTGTENPWRDDVPHRRRYTAALDDARMARFEHGQSGRPS